MEARIRRRAGFIRGDFQSLALAAALLALTAIPSPSLAELGCFRDGAFSAATCTEAADCGPVGGTDCTSGVCLCNAGPLAPFCACAIEPAPAASHSILVLMVGLLTAIAAFGLRQRARAGQ